MAITILGALYKRKETGQGCRLQVAMQDAIMHYMRINFATQGLTGKPASAAAARFLASTTRRWACIRAPPAAPTTTSTS